MDINALENCINAGINGDIGTISDDGRSGTPPTSDTPSYQQCSAAQTVLRVPRHVAYVSSDEYVRNCDQLPRVSERASMVHTLIEAYGLLQHMSIVVPSPANEKDLRLFHSAEYIDCLSSTSEQNDEEKIVDKLEEFGLAYDCPVFANLYNCVTFVVGGTLAAADCLLTGTCDVAINWAGGWHHAKRDEAAGFCYINDVVLGILRLRQKYNRILYVDFDLHHGDGVEDAFCATGKVLTVSFHKHSPGFFPGSGSMTDAGVGKGKYYAVNIPLKDGIDDNQFISVFHRVLSGVRECFRPDAVVCQCGADTLAGDPHACFNLTSDALAKCLQYVMGFGVPLLLLGGGGYNFANTARCWTSLTATVLALSLPSEIPEHQYFTQYGPGFDLGITPSYIRNKNTAKDLEDTISAVLDNLENIVVDD